MKLSRFAVCVLLGSSLWAQESPAVNTQASNEPRLRPAAEGRASDWSSKAGSARIGSCRRAPMLEENRIPGDVIAGASMGSLVAESTQRRVS